MNAQVSIFSILGVGGAFLFKEGKAKHHVMRDFSKTPLENEEQMNNWLKFYNMSAPMITVGTFVNADMVNNFNFVFVITFCGLTLYMQLW